MEQLELFDTKKLIRNHLVEYLFVISPDLPTKNKVIELKKKLHAIIDISQLGLMSKPHVSIIDFRFAKENDEQIIELTTNALNSVTSFIAEIKGVSTFINGKESRTLILNFENPMPIIQIQKLLSISFFNKTSSYNPHITIANSIPISKFEQIQDLSIFDYKGILSCSNISLLKRTISNGKESPFLNIHDFVLR
jgi:2'-5' RNA ligase